MKYRKPSISVVLVCLITIAVMLAACGGGEVVEEALVVDETTSAPEEVTGEEPATEPEAMAEEVLVPAEDACPPVSEIAASVVGEWGQVRMIEEREGCQQLLILEEEHSSRAAQIEIALMLNRLYHQYGLRDMALEGALVEEDNLDPDWYHASLDGEVTREVALKLLEQGDLTAAEFALIVFPDFSVHRIEHESEYEVGITGDAAFASNAYLDFIALTTLTDEDWEELEQLLTEAEEEGQTSEYIVSLYIGFVYSRAYLDDSNPWAGDDVEDIMTAYIRMMLSSNAWLESLGEAPPGPHLVSCLDLVRVMDAIRMKADEASDELDISVDEYVAGFWEIEDIGGALEEEKQFYEMCVARDYTMIEYTLPVVAERAPGPVVLNVGAAHSAGLTGLLDEEGVSYAVIATNAFMEDVNNGDLYTAAYNRVDEGLSVDVRGALGAYLDGRHKPQPRINTPFVRLKAWLMGKMAVLARDAGDGELDLGAYGDDFFQCEYGVIPRDSIVVLPDGVVQFAVDVQLPEQAPQTLHVLTLQTDTTIPQLDSELTLEEALKRALERVESEEEINTMEEEEEVESAFSEEEPAITEVAIGVHAMVSPDVNGLNADRLRQETT
jgi:hypothetical protein